MYSFWPKVLGWTAFPFWVKTIVSSNSLSEIKISIGSAKIFIPASETALINSIIKDLMLNV